MMDLTTIKKVALQDTLLRVMFGLVIAAGLFWFIRAGLTLIEPSRAYKSVDNLSTATGAFTKPRSEGVQFDPKFDPFHRGNNGETQAPLAAVIGEGAPETDLNLKLKGRRASGDGTGSATLKLPDGEQKVVVQGEVILRNVSLEAVYDSHIIISRNGVHERVTFKRNESALTPSGEAVTKTSAAETLPIKNDFKSKFSSLTTAEIIDKLRFSPVKEGAKVKGYRLQVRDGSFDLLDMGYQPGDLVTHINEQDLRHGRPEFELIFKQIKRNPNTTSLTIDRNGDEINLSLN